MATYLNEENSLLNFSLSRYSLNLDGVVNVSASGFSLCISLVKSVMFLASLSFAKTTSRPNVKGMKSSRNASNETVLSARVLFILL